MLVLAAYRRNLGFSLIELMVAVAIFGILAAFAIPSYKAMIGNNLTRNAAESIQTGLQVARGEAVKRNAAVQLDLRGTNSAWTVCIRPSPAGACPNPDNATTIQSRSLGEGSSTAVTVAPTDAAPYVFNSLGVMISPVPAAADGLVRIQVDNTSVASGDRRTLQVVIGVGGSSRMCDTDSGLDSADPRRCPP